MNWIDIIIIIPIILGIYRGYRIGIITQITYCLSWILGFYGMDKLAIFIAPLLKKTSVINGQYNYLISLILSFLLIFWSVHLLKILISYVMSISYTYFINRFFGALLGLIKSFLYMAIIVFLFSKLNNYISLISSDYLNNSILLQKIFSFNHFLYDKVSEIFSKIENTMNILI